jgi:hypothetical protein
VFCFQEINMAAKAASKKVSKTMHERKAGTLNLKPADWQSGDHLWVVTALGEEKSSTTCWSARQDALGRQVREMRV